MERVSSRLICVFVTVVMLLASMPGQAPLNALKTVDATDLRVLNDTSSPSMIASPEHTRVSTVLLNSPMMFIENVGQFTEDVRFQVRGGDRTIWLAEDAIWVTVLETPDKVTQGQEDQRAFATSIDNPKSETQNQKGVNLKLSFVGANPHPRLEPFNRLAVCRRVIYRPYFLAF